MFRETSFHKVFALVLPGLRGRVGALMAVTLLAALAAFGEKAPLLLLQPLVDRVLFPGQLAAGEAGTAGENASAAAPSALDGIRGLQARAQDWFFGPEGAISSHGERERVLLRVILVGALLGVLTAGALYAFTRLARWVALRMVIDLRLRLARHLVGLSMRYHGERSFGDLLSRVTNDASATLNVLDIAFKELVREPLLVLASLGVAFAAAPLPTAVLIVLLPLVMLPIAILGRKVKRRSRKSRLQLGASLQVLSQMFRGIRTVKAFRAEQRELDRYRRANEDYLKSALKMVRALATIQGATALLSQVGMMAVLLLAGLMTLRWKLFDTAGEMLQFAGGVGLIYNHVKRITNAANNVQEAAGAAERLQQVLDEPADIRERPGAASLVSLGSGIAFEDVSLTYPGQTEPALRELSLQIRPGETLALVGPSGAGKSTLVDLVARFLDPSSGRILVDGRDLRDVTLDSWTGLYALVGQVPFLFHASVLENIRYGRPEATRAEVEAAARAANIHDFIAALPAGYETVVGEDGARLSGGQRQRITIARALLKGAPLLLLDEATSALDSEAEAVVQEALDRLMQDRTVIVIAHRLSTIRNADRIAVLSRGRLVELGGHEELLARRGTYARLHAVQFASAKGVGA